MKTEAQRFKEILKHLEKSVGIVEYIGRERLLDRLSDFDRRRLLVQAERAYAAVGSLAKFTRIKQLEGKT